MSRREVEGVITDYNMNGIEFFISDLPALNAIKLGKFFYKPREIERITSRMVRPIANEYVADEPTLGLIGTGTLLQTTKMQFVACTRHQLGLPNGGSFKEAHLAHVRVTSYEDEALKNIPIDGVRFVTDNTDEEFSDLILLKVAQDWPGLAKEIPYFAQLGSAPRSTRRKSWLIGFPSNQNQIDMENKKFNSVCRIVGCELDESFRTHSRSFRRFKFKKPEEDLDGYSGGAIFSMFGEIEEMEVRFDGLVTRGGSEFVHVISPSIIARLANSFS
jgi:hypothetical protein